MIDDFLIQGLAVGGFVIGLLLDLLNLDEGESVFKRTYKWVVPEGGIFIPIDDLALKCDKDIHGRKLYDNNGEVWAQVFSNGLSVRGGYAWDGCSPKIKVFGVILGTWDGKHISQKVQAINGIEETIYEQQMYIPSLFHDVCCQFRDQLTFSLAWRQLWVDNRFRDLAYKNKFKYAKQYYKFVRMYQQFSGNG